MRFLPHQPDLPPIHPHICVLGGLDAIAFYERAFDAECTLKLLHDDGISVRYAQLSVFGGRISMHDEMPDCRGGVLSPEEWPTSFALTVTVTDPDDVNAAMQRAVEHGAEIVFETVDMREWGVRYGRVRDPFGHVWAFQAMLPCN